MVEVIKDLEQAGITITSKIKIIGISISLIITPDFITDYSHKVKKLAEADFEPVPRDPILDLKKLENMAKGFDPSDISTNKFL
jgi:hypothetical protein